MLALPPGMVAGKLRVVTFLTTTAPLDAVSQLTMAAKKGTGLVPRRLAGTAGLLASTRWSTSTLSRPLESRSPWMDLIAHGNGAAVTPRIVPAAPMNGDTLAKAVLNVRTSRTRMPSPAAAVWDASPKARGKAPPSATRDRTSLFIEPPFSSRCGAAQAAPPARRRPCGISPQTTDGRHEVITRTGDAGCSPPRSGGGRRRGVSRPQQGYRRARYLRPARGQGTVQHPDRQRHDRQAAEHGRGQPRPAVERPAERQPPEDQGQPGGQHAGGLGPQEPRHPRVAAGPQAVQEPKRPGQVREPVDEPPEPEAYAPAHEAGDNQGGDELRRDHAQAQPERAIPGAERDERVFRPEPGERVQNRRRDVDRQEADDQDRDVLVQRHADVLGPDGRLPAHGRARPEHHRRGQEHHRDRSGAAVRVPERARCRRQQDHPHHRSSGQPPTVTTLPSVPTRRAGRPRSSSQSAALAPITIAAVAAALAARQLSAAAVAVRHGPRAGAPVAGSMM